MPARQASTTRSGPEVMNIGAATAGMLRRPSNAAGIGNDGSLRWEDGDRRRRRGGHFSAHGAAARGPPSASERAERVAMFGAAGRACSMEVAAFEKGQIGPAGLYAGVARHEKIAVAQ